MGRPRPPGPRGPCRPFGIGILAFVGGIFTALIFPMWLLASLEGIMVIVLGCYLLRR